MKSTSLAALALALSFSALPAAAQGVGEPSIGLGITSLGPVLQGGFRITPNVGMRAFYAGIPTINDTIEVDDINYDVSGRLGGFALMGDFFAGARNFRVSAGVFVSNSEFDGNVTASPSNPIEVGAATFNSGETVDTHVEFANKIAPIVTIGYVHQTRRKLFLSAEAGVIAMNGFDVTVVGTGIPQSNLDAEAENARNELNKLKVYPYVSLMAGFRF
ncbi:MAG: hypothetical protein ACRBBU_10215 [Pseudooceanicola sp.]